MVNRMLKLNATSLTALASLFVLLLLAGCTTQPLNSELSPSSVYQNTNRYADHRAQQRYFNSSGGKLAYLDVSPSDTAPVLLMIHGVPSSSWLYRKMLPELQQHYRVIAVDLLGYGSSDKPEAGDDVYSTDQQAKYVNELVAALGVNQFSIIFHDMGGLVAWNLMAQDTQRINDIIVLNTIIGKHGFNHPNMDKGAVARMMSQAFSGKLSSAAALEMTFNNMGLNAETKLSGQECFGYVAPMQEGADNALYSFFTGFDDSLFTEIEQQQSALAEFTGNVLVLWGAKDKVLTTEQLPQLRTLFTRAEYREIIYPDNAHFLPEEIPQQLAAEVVTLKMP